MRGFLLFLFLFSYIMPAISQDIIIEKTGKKISCIVMKRSEDTVLYKLFNNPVDSTYAIPSYRVDRIEFAWGGVEHPEDWKTVSPEKKAYLDSNLLGYIYDLAGVSATRYGEVLRHRDAVQLFAPYPDIQQSFRSGHRYAVTGTCLLVASSFVVGWNIGAYDDGVAGSGELLLYGGLGLLVSIAPYIIGQTKKKRAIEKYNGIIQNESSKRLELRLKSTGLGLGYRF